MSPAERADKVREAVPHYELRNSLTGESSGMHSEDCPACEIADLLPPGSVILTAEEAEGFRWAFDSDPDEWEQPEWERVRALRALLAGRPS